jgi:uncharacterized protein (UPF0332 family)
MNSEERDTLVRYRIQRAHETLSEASVLMEQDLWNGSINRLYYAMFYAAVALLAQQDVFPKTHKGVRQQFSLLFLATGTISDELGLAYAELFERRHSGDYDDFVSIDAEVVFRLHEQTLAMVGAIEDLLKRK